MQAKGIIEGMGKVTPGKEYDLTELHALGVFPCRDMRTLRKVIQRDQEGENLLEARIEGEGNRTRYSIKGVNINRFLKKYGPGLGMVVPKREQ